MSPVRILGRNTSPRRMAPTVPLDVAFADPEDAMGDWEQVGEMVLGSLCQHDKKLYTYINIYIYIYIYTYKYEYINKYIYIYIHI